MTTFVDYDHFTGITETFYKDPMSDVIKVNKSKDLTESFNHIARERNASSTGWKESFHKVATIDPIVIDMWREELKAKGYPNPDPLAKENKMWLIAKLNSRDFQKLRTKEGVI